MIKMLRSALCTTAALAATLAASPSQAAFIATLEFVTPNAIVLSNQPIDVRVRLRVDPTSDALTTDASGRITSGFDFGSYMGPIDLTDPDTFVRINEFLECSGTFSCGSPQYSFDFNYALPNFISPQNLNLQPGDTVEWVFGTYTPVGGNAPAGVYNMFNVGFFVSIDNFDDPNNVVSDSGGNLAQTCAGQNPQCAFTRTVLAAPNAVPEPATWAMMIGGFGAIGGAMRYRRRKTAVSFG